MIKITMAVVFLAENMYLCPPPPQTHTFSHLNTHNHTLLTFSVGLCTVTGTPGDARVLLV